MRHLKVGDGSEQVLTGECESLVPLLLLAAAQLRSAPLCKPHRFADASSNQCLRLQVVINLELFLDHLEHCQSELRLAAGKNERLLRLLRGQCEYVCATAAAHDVLLQKRS